MAQFDIYENKNEMIKENFPYNINSRNFNNFNRESWR